MDSDAASEGNRGSVQVVGQGMGDPNWVTHRQEDLSGTSQRSPAAAEADAGPGLEVEYAAQALGAWVLETIRLSGRKLSPIARTLGTTRARLDALADGDVSVVTLQRLYTLAAMMERDVPWDVVKAMAVVEKARHAPSTVDATRDRPSGGARGSARRSVRAQRAIAVQPDAAFDVSGGTVREEIEAVIRVVEDLRQTHEKHRNRAILAARFGAAGGRPTLQAIGTRFGLTRQRIEQMERRFLTHVGEAQGRWRAAQLARLREILLAARAMPAGKIEAAHADLLGGASIRPALRLVKAMWGGALSIETVRRGAWAAPVIVADAAGDAALVLRTLAVARRLQGYAGACSLGDLQRVLEDEGRRDIDGTGLRAIVEASEGTLWHDLEHTWFSLPMEGVSTLEKRALTILSVAGQPVQLDILNGGLSREPRSRGKSLAARNTPAAPPRAIVASIFDHSPRIARSHGNLFRLAVEFDGLAALEGAERTLIEHILAHGGVMAKPDMLGLRLEDGRPLTRSYVGMLLSRTPCLVRVARCVYAIRGRTLDPVALEDAMGKAGDRPSRGRSRMFAIQVIDPLRQVKRSAIYARKRDVPEGAEGEYRVAGAAGACELVDDVHGPRVKRLAALRSALVVGGTDKQLVFDRDARTVVVQDANVDRGHAGTTYPSEDRDHGTG